MSFADFLAPMERQAFCLQRQNVSHDSTCIFSKGEAVVARPANSALAGGIGIVRYPVAQSLIDLLKMLEFIVV